MNRLFPSADSVRPRRALFSRYDLLVIPLILSLLYLLTLAFRGAAGPFGPGAPDLTVSLEPANLPYYGLRSLFRMAVAVLFSLLFTFTVATLAAKSPRAERLIIPALDFLQSLPILGFLTVTTAIFLGLFRGSLWGLEAASIFAIFTSQVWNMAFSFYHSLVTVPKELQEAATQFRLSPWQRFWRLEVPFATPSLVWNTMMSVSGGWFFVVASEVISVVGRDREQYLPGLGSYLAVAIQQANLTAMAYTALAILVLILIYDQLFFRPIVAWAEKFKVEGSGSGDVPTSWMLTLLQRSRFVPRLAGEMQLDIDDLFPLTDAADLLGFARVEGGDITLLPSGQAFVDADILRRKEIFAEHLVRRVPLIAHIRKVLDTRPEGRVPEERFLRELEDFMGADGAGAVLETAIDWGRYAELFEYDYNAGVLTLEAPEPASKQAG